MKKNKYYNWHSGAPSDKEYNEMTEAVSRIKKKIIKNRLNFDPFEKIEKNKLIKSYKFWTFIKLNYYAIRKKNWITNSNRKFN